MIALPGFIGNEAEGSEGVRSSQGDFVLNGNYFLGGTEGLQKGRVTYFDDGLIYGRARDCNSGREEDLGYENFLFGLHFPKEREVAFLKWDYSPDNLKPVFWWMSFSENHSGDSSFEGKYDGFYAFADGHLGATIVENQLRMLGRSPSIGEIRKVGLDELTDVFFNDVAREAVYSCGEGLGQYGSVRFEEV